MRSKIYFPEQRGVEGAAPYDVAEDFTSVLGADGNIICAIGAVVIFWYSVYLSLR